jgi:hypothetical protein
MSMPAVAADPAPPPTRMIDVDPIAWLIFNDVHTEDIDVAAFDLDFLHDCPTQDDTDSAPNENPKNGGNAFDDFDFDNIYCDVDDGVVNGDVFDPKCQRSYNLDVNDQDIYDTTLHETLEMTAIAATHDALSEPLRASEARAMQILENKKATKFKDKSDMEMKKIRNNNVLSKGHH